MTINKRLAALENRMAQDSEQMDDEERAREQERQAIAFYREGARRFGVELPADVTLRQAYEGLMNALRHQGKQPATTQATTTERQGGSQ